MVKDKANSRLAYLRTLTDADSNTKFLVHKTLVCPILDYASVIRLPGATTKIQQIEEVQRRAICFVYKIFSLRPSYRAFIGTWSFFAYH